jgi:hypothetical protein
MMMKNYFKTQYEESIIVMALDLAKKNYACIRDNYETDTDIAQEMEERIKAINNFLTWTAIKKGE